MKQLIIISALLVSSMTIWAQGGTAPQRPNREAQKEKIEAMRVAYITKELNLTTKEAQVFWPLYNEYEAKRKTIRKNGEKMGNLDVMSDAEVERTVETRLSMEQEALDLKRAYIQKMSQVIPLRKVARLQRVEKEFRGKVLKEVRSRRGQGAQGKRRPNK